MGNTFGRILRMTTFGESHGPALGLVLDGVPAGISITEEYIQKELDKRKPGQSTVTTQRKEEDKVSILSGVFDGKTTGAPLCMVVFNKDADPSQYQQIKDLYRPGHADYTYAQKYGIRDYRGGGRSSGRETLARVAAGAVAKKMLEEHNISVISYTLSIGNITAKSINYKEIEKNPVRCPDKQEAKKMEKLILGLKEEGDSIGGIIETVIKNCPAGLGDPIYDKLEAALGAAILSIGAIKGIEFGEGFRCALLRGSENNDSFAVDKKGKAVMKTNHAGGILGGISTGDDIIFRAVIKPASSIRKSQKTIDTKGREAEIRVEGRHDPCLCPRAVPVIEHMTRLVIADALLAQRLSRWS